MDSSEIVQWVSVSDLSYAAVQKIHLQFVGSLEQTYVCI